jgi:hypothetical protein
MFYPRGGPIVVPQDDLIMGHMCLTELNPLEEIGSAYPEAVASAFFELSRSRARSKKEREEKRARKKAKARKIKA